MGVRKASIVLLPRRLCPPRNPRRDQQPKLINIRMKIRDIIESDTGEPGYGYEGQRDVALESLVTTLRQECQPWLQATDNGMYYVYRGFNRGVRTMANYKDASYAFRQKVRMDRKPLDTKKPVHDFFNNLIAACGKKANRSNSSFCYGRNIKDSLPPSASSYGKSMVVLPVGQFNYTWHKYVRDWTTDWDKTFASDYGTNDPAKIKTDFGVDINNPEEYGKHIFQKLHSRHQVPKNWRDDLRLPIKNAYWKNSPEFHKAALNDQEWMSEFCSGMHGDDNTLKLACDTRRMEIMLHSTEIIAIEPRVYEDVVWTLNEK